MAPDLWRSGVADALARLARGVSLYTARRKLLRRGSNFRKCGGWAQRSTCGGCGAATHEVLAACDCRVCPWCARVFASGLRKALALCFERWESQRPERYAKYIGLRMLTVTHPFDECAPESFAPSSIDRRCANLRNAVRALRKRCFTPARATAGYWTIEIAPGGHVHLHLVWWGRFVDCRPDSEVMRVAQKYIGPELRILHAQQLDDVTPAGAIVEIAKYITKGPSFAALNRGLGSYLHPAFAAAVEFALRGARMRGGFGDLKNIQQLAESLQAESVTASECERCGCDDWKTLTGVASDVLRGAPVDGVCGAPAHVARVSSTRVHDAPRLESKGAAGMRWTDADSQLAADARQRKLDNSNKRGRKWIAEADARLATKLAAQAGATGDSSC